MKNRAKKLAPPRKKENRTVRVYARIDLGTAAAAVAREAGNQPPEARQRGIET